MRYFSYFSDTNEPIASFTPISRYRIIEYAFGYAIFFLLPSVSNFSSTERQRHDIFAEPDAADSTETLSSVFSLLPLRDDSPSGR
jgi:hypothetical protein